MKINSSKKIVISIMALLVIGVTFKIYFDNKSHVVNKGVVMQKVVMYSKVGCPYCTMAKNLLNQKGVNDIIEIKIDEFPEKRAEMINKTGRETVPQIFIGKTHVGGFDDLSDLNRAGKLDTLLISND